MKYKSFALFGAMVLLIVTMLSMMPVKTHHRKPFSMYRHIYNNSNQSWTFQVVDNRGNVWFGVPTCQARSKNSAHDATRAMVVNPNNQKNGPFELGPHCSVKIHYTTTDDVASGTWKITDTRGVTREWSYYGLGLRDEAPKIEHSGRTGSAYLNDPADGDITIGEDFWN